jgi:hypothetical protein
MEDVTCWHPPFRISYSSGLPSKGDCPFMLQAAVKPETVHAGTVS